ncbi:hypothetical protein INS49_011691 [Diaporthe citri]|uniref:uncharacterized protein n=1 Tax=Diaporthe citri TaxID=83186 RepID=UPI001C7E44E9|nr:uncharacterized protein INS49_011691 [Diaporthe citri]KAG6360627.1 hypothetical protein INS49_011691 [Diaporthe citri]
MSTAPSRPSVPSDPRSTRSTVPPTREHGNPKQPAAQPPEVKPEPPTPPCYVVTARGGDTGCERRPVSTAGELQAQVSELVKQGTQAAAAASDVFTAASAKHASGVEGAARPLITIYGLPAAFVPVLLDSPLDIDLSFVEAHAAGRSYRPMGIRRRRGPRAARYAHWDYPELVAGDWQAIARKRSCQGFEQNSIGPGLPQVVADLAREPVVRPVSDAGKGLAAVFCRASLWVSQDVDVLFLDKPRWEERGPLRKARRAGKVTGYNAPIDQENRPRYGGTKGDNVAVAQWNGEEIPSLESILQDSPATTCKDSGVLQVLEETAYEQWLELFEVLTPRRRVVKPERTSLEWQIMRALEQNFDMAKRTARSQNGSGTEEGFAVGPADWEGLIQRLRTRAEILTATCPGLPHKKPERTASGALYHQERMAYVPRHRPEADRPSSQGSDSDNQRALDRVTYLGGILLPFSIVSGVLSMNEGFEPGQPLFWVFWVATIPLTLFTVLVIYADKLRQVEVWSEVLDHSGSDSEGDRGSTKSGDGDKVQEAEKGKRKPMPEFGISKYSRPQQPEAVTYSAGGDVVIDLDTPTAETQQMPTAESPRPYGADPRMDSDEDQEQEGTSSDEDTAEEVALPMTAGETGYHPGWKKKQLGWKGAAMCMLRMKKPLRVLDGMPVAARGGQRDD